MPRPTNTKERRRQIVRALIKVMAERGYERASVAEIARAADLTPGLLHYHFESKQEILLALVDQMANDLDQRVWVRLEQAGDDPRAQLDAFIDGHLAVVPDEGAALAACWVAAGAEAIRQPEVRAAWGRIVAASIRRLEKLVKAAMPRDAAAGVTPAAIAQSIYASIQGYLVLVASAPDEAHPRTAAAAVRRTAGALLHAAPGLRTMRLSRDDIDPAAIEAARKRDPD